MNFKRIGRALVCLLLVCCLCFNMATIPAKASVLGQTLWILGESVIASIIKGCGVHAGEEAADFNQVVSQCWEDIKADTQWYEWILGDEMMVQKFGSDADKVSYYVHLTLLETVRLWLFDSGVVSAPVASTYHSFTIGDTAYEVTSDTPCEIALFWRTGYAYYAGYTVAAYAPIANSSSLTITMGDKTFGSKKFGDYYVTTIMGGSGTTYNSYCPDTSLPVTHDESGLTSSDKHFEKYFGVYVPELVTSRDLVLKSLKTPSVSFATGYQDWTANSVTVEAESDAAEDEVYYPLALGQTYEETVDMTQEDVWAGNSTYVEVTVDSEITADSVAATPWATFTQWISAGWAKLETAVLSIPATVIAGIQSIFVPTEDFVTVKVEAIQAEFPFVSPIIDVGKFIGGSLSGFETSPPIIYIDLGATRGPYDIGGKVAFIDMTWYAEYKPTVDLLLSAFLWIVFWWKMFKRLPGLISGAPGDFVMEGLNMVGLADYLPSRNAAYEIQRRDNHNSVWRRR